MMELTPRQQREREYYDQYACRAPVEDLSFDPVDSDERRPWNSYWDSYRLVADLYGESHRRLIDLGAGEGSAAVRYAKVGYDVWAVDISEHNVEKARELAARHGLGRRTRFSVQAVENLEFPNDMFDVAVGIDILHHVDIPRAVREVKRVLAPGGIAVFREWAEVPVLDAIRKTALMRMLFPRVMSFDDHITWDEHPLTKDELQSILAIFPAHEIRRYGLTSRLRKVAPAPRSDIADQLEKLDHMILGAIPPARLFGSEILLILHKPGPTPSTPVQPGSGVFRPPL